MTVDVLAALFDLTGIVLTVTLSIPIYFWRPDSFLASWLLAYASTFAVVLWEFAMQIWGEPPFAIAIGVCLVVVCGLLHVRTAQIHMSGKAADRRLFQIWFGASALFGGVALLGFSHVATYLLPVVAMAMCFQYLGVTLLRRSHDRGGLWVGLPLIALGLWLLTYPVLVPSSHAWIGFSISGILNLVTGIGMLLFVLRRTVETVDSQNRELRSLDTLKNEFLGNVNHELRTPLSSIKTAVHLLSRETTNTNLTEQQRDMIAILSANSDRLNGLVSELMDYTMFSTGTVTDAKVPTDLNALVSRVFALEAYRFEAKMIQTQFVPGETPLVCAADTPKLERVLLNLLVNAAKFTPREGQVELCLSQTEEYARIELRNSGERIPEEELERIFERFYQLHSSTTRRFSGTGLGLAICRSIVENGHGGKIWAESADTGTKFIVLLPLIPSKADTLPMMATSQT